MNKPRYHETIVERITRERKEKEAVARNAASKKILRKEISEWALFALLFVFLLGSMVLIAGAFYIPPAIP